LQPIALYYGNDEAAAPRYDAKLIAAQLLRSERTAVALGRQEILKSGRVTETLRGSDCYIFWVAFGIVVAALSLLISRLLLKVVALVAKSVNFFRERNIWAADVQRNTERVA